MFDDGGKIDPMLAKIANLTRERDEARAALNELEAKVHREETPHRTRMRIAEAEVVTLTKERDEAVIERDNIEARIVAAIDKAWSEPGDAPSDLSAEVARVVRTVRIAVHEKRRLTEQRDEARAEVEVWRERARVSNEHEDAMGSDHDRMLPVYEAAKAWRTADCDGLTTCVSTDGHAEECQWTKAEDRFWSAIDTALAAEGKGEG